LTGVIRLSRHATEAIEARRIAIEWIEAAIVTPDWTEADPAHPDRTRSYKAVAELGGRILRVVHRTDGNDVIVITAHPDRDATP